MKMDKNVELDYYIDTEEFDAEFEAQQIFLQRQYEERKKQEELKNKELKSVKSEYEKNELEEIEKKADFNTNIYLQSKYMFCYKNEIVNNDILGKCSLHYILGSLLRDKKIYKTPFTWLDYRIHLILIQMSGTGKGMTAGFIERLLDKIKFPIIDIKTNKLLSQKKWRKVNKITSGVSTPQSLIDTYIIDKGEPKVDKKTGVEIVKKGSLSKQDFFIYEEGGHLFNNSQASNEMTDSFLRAMEPIGSSNNKIDKKLTSYNNSLTTTSKSSIFIMTRPMGKMKKTVAGSGFFQRCLFIPREIEYDIVNEMRINSGLNDLDFMAGEKNEINLEKYDDLISEFIEVIEFAYNNEITINKIHKEKIKTFYKSKMMWFHDDMINDINSEDMQYITCSLQNRYKDNMFKLAYHSAVMRYSKYVDLEDFQYAFNILKELYEEQKEWLSGTLEVSYIEKKENQEFKKILINIVKNDRNGLKNFDMIIKDVCKIIDINYNVCKKKIMAASVGTNAIVKIDNPSSSDSKIRLI